MGEYTTNNYFYKPALGANGEVERGKFHDALDVTDAEVKANKDAKHAHSNKTELDKLTDGDHDVRTDNPHSVVLSDISEQSNNGEISIYVDNAGDDSNSGLSGSPVLTLAQAIANIPAIPRENGASTTVSIILTAGQTFDIDDLYIQVPWISTLEIKTSSAGNTATLEVGNGVKGLIIYRSFVGLTDITIQKRGTGQTHSVYCRDHTYLRVGDNCSFSGATSYEIGLYRSSTCYFQGTLVGDSSAHGIAIHSSSYLQMSTGADISDYDRGIVHDRGGASDLNAGIIDNCTRGIHSEDGALAKWNGIDITNCTYAAYAQTGGQVIIATVGGGTTGNTNLYGVIKDGFIYYDGVIYRGSHYINGDLDIRDTSDLGNEIHTEANAASDPNANEANTTTGWSIVAGTLTSSAVSPQTGTYCLKGVATDGSNDRLEYGFTSELGKLYRISFWAKRGAAGTTQKIQTWENLDPIPSITIDTTTWTEYVFYVRAITSTAAKIRIYAAVAGSANDEVYVDNVSIKEVVGGDLDIEGNLTIHKDTFNLARTKTPATSGATGIKGDICWDADYIYICTATDTWERAAIATW